MTDQTREKLLDCARKFETADFLSADPSFFMHQVSGTLNAEATAFVAASLAFGSRSQFMPLIASILEAAKGEMDSFIRSGAFESAAVLAGDGVFYRFYSRAQMRAFLARFREILVREGSLGAALRRRAPSCALDAVKILCDLFADTAIVPKDASSACKRLCMFLRWMVRPSSPVDLGLWADFIDPATLIMPLDVHVLRQSRALGLVSCASPSMATARRLTATLADIFPGDPLKGDFALFGLGISQADEPYSFSSPNLSNRKHL